MNSWVSGLLIGILGSVIVFTALAAAFRRQMLARQQHIRRFLKHIRANRLHWQTRARRAERLAEVGTLTSGLAHEIKNPLSTVQLNLQLLQEDLDPNNPASGRIINRLNTVSREASRLRDILDDFLKYAGKIELQRRIVDLNELLEELADFFAPQAQLNRVQLRLKPHAGPLMVSIDPRLIKQAVLNLMLNALQAMPRGGELILSASTTQAASPQAVIDVIDTGPGIPADQIQKIFQAYYSTRKGGTGLGLAMTRRIVEEHGGQIGVRSEPAKGTNFYIKLPMG